MNEAALSVGGIVLCGGRSSRMGQPKAWLPFGSETMLQRVVRILEEVVAPVVVVAAPGQALPSLSSQTLVVHDAQEHRGPLAGMAAGLAALTGRADAGYVSACDTPLLRPAFIRAVLSQLQSHELAVPYDGQYHHPLAAVYRTSLQVRIDKLLAEQRMRPLFLIQESDANVIDVEQLRNADPNLDSLRNTNTPEGYREVLRLAGMDAE